MGEGKGRRREKRESGEELWMKGKEKGAREEGRVRVKGAAEGARERVVGEREAQVKVKRRWSS